MHFTKVRASKYDSHLWLRVLIVEFLCSSTFSTDLSLLSILRTRSGYDPKKHLRRCLEFLSASMVSPRSSLLQSVPRARQRTNEWSHDSSSLVQSWYVTPSAWLIGVCQRWSVGQCPLWKHRKSVMSLMLYWVVAKVLKACKKCDWIAFKSQLLKFYQTDSNVIYSIVFAILFYIMISKPMSYLCDRTRRNKLSK